MDKFNFHLIFGLAKKQPWLVNKYQELQTLLFEEAKRQEQRDLLLELINDFRYLDSNNYANSQKELAELIVTDPDLTDESTAVVAMTRSSKFDSGQNIAYALKPWFSEFGWSKFLDINTADKCYKKVKENPQIKNVVLVDELVGSGKTVTLTHDSLKELFSDKGLNIEIRACVIAACSVGAQELKKSGIKLNSLYELKRGISDRDLSSQEISDKLELMRELERSLEPVVNDSDLPSLGYGETEALYCRDGGNTPNSVFPIFWWPQYLGKTPRSSILTRAVKDL
ncbi:phosphoribosyltransferase [Idiomarina abyssalis]|uniref:phosphoribosyltransferase n=1 Tax=Idiomarina abyssalis TaxID=86102 RepID=UPI001C943416|nr:phosphoribosyltransferase [Idiomarina abyssalis]QZN90550.1 phosphoribosyltransferase [Idiomarina abyssalis]